MTAKKKVKEGSAKGGSRKDSQIPATSVERDEQGHDDNKENERVANNGKDTEDGGKEVREAAHAVEEGVLKASEQTREYRLLCQRRSQLRRTEHVLRGHNVVVQRLVDKAREDLVWGQYMKCDGLPDPVCVRQLNTYLSLWRDDDREDVDAVLGRTKQVLPILNSLENLLEHPEEWESPAETEDAAGGRLAERNRIFYEMKSLQLKKLNRATYNLLRDVSPMVDPENNLLQHFLSSPLVSLGLWGNAVSAKSLRVKGADFAELGFGFELPADLVGNVFAVRVMRVEYDHYSKMCRSNKIPPKAAKDVPSYFEQVQHRISEIEAGAERKREDRRALKEAFEEQRRAMEEAEREKQRLQLLERKSKKKAATAGVISASASAGAGTAPTGGKTTLAEAEEMLAEKTQKLQRQKAELLQKEKELEWEDAEHEHQLEVEAKTDARKDATGMDDVAEGTARKEKDPQQAQKELLQERLDFYSIETDEHELNLRRNIILGGVFYFDMLKIPPQPKKVGNWIICQLETPQVLKTVSWHADYRPPLPPDENTVTKKTPEEIEREIKLQEMELQKLVLVHLKLPASSLWFEPPTIVRWQPEDQYWSTEGFYDTKFDEGKQTLSFRTVSFGIFALSAFRFSNLPLQSWEITPLDGNKCVIALSAAAVQSEFEIGEGTVTLVKFSSGNKPPVQGLLDQPMILKDLVKQMRTQGVDIFPDYDSHCYIEGLPLKDIQTERHLYSCMALTANALNFAWSRWNLLSGYDKLIMQYREKVPGHPETPQQVILVTPEKTSVLECTEASQTFCPKAVEGFDSLVDLYTMAMDKCSEEVKQQLPKAKAVFVNTVYQFLCSTKVISYA